MRAPAITILAFTVSTSVNAFTPRVSILHTDVTRPSHRSQTLLLSIENKEKDDLKKHSSRSNEIPTVGGPIASRRSTLETMGKDLASLLLISSTITTLSSSPPSAGAKVPDDNYIAPPKVIVITGCNSGIGFDAAQRMAERGHTVIMACRTLSKANLAALRIQQEATTAATTGKVIPKECDLADLDSVRAFAEGLKDNGISNIDALCLNAGLARSTSAEDVKRTKQGFELTVGTNHLGHFLLSQLLLPLVRKDTGRIVVTASGVHDPASPGGAQGSKATLGNLEGFESAVKHGSSQFEMVDGKSFDPDKAYKDSKLCNVLFSLELQRRVNKDQIGIAVNSFNPGLIVATGLFRDQNQVFTKVFDVAATNILKVGENTHWGGGALEYITLDKSVGLESGKYFSSPPGSSKYGDEAYGNQFIPSIVSREAMDDAKAKRLWELSESLVGI